MDAEQFAEPNGDNERTIQNLRAERETLLQREKGSQLVIAAMTVKLGEIIRDMKMEEEEACRYYAKQLSALLPLDTEGWIREHDRELLERAAEIADRVESTDGSVIWACGKIAESIRALLPTTAGKPSVGDIGDPDAIVPGPNPK